MRHIYSRSQAYITNSSHCNHKTVAGSVAKVSRTGAPMTTTAEPQLHRCWDPEVQWDTAVQAYFESILGADRLHSISQAIACPPSFACIRVNTTAATPSSLLSALPSALSPEDQDLVSTPGYQPFIHPQVPQAIILPASGPHPVDYSETNGKEVVVGRLAGEAMLKGANLYTPGILACSAGIEAGDVVAVSVGIEMPGSKNFGLTRASIISPDLPLDDPRLPNRYRLFIGTGRALLSRVQMFAQHQGQALEMVQRVYRAPSLFGVLKGQMMLQTLPSMLAAVVLDPKPGSRVLDMCASPGGKTTALAEIMGDQGEVVAIDRTHNKAAAVEELAADLGLKCIKAMKADSRKILGTGLANRVPDEQVSEAARKRIERKQDVQRKLNVPVIKAPARTEVCDGFPPDYFDHILLDAPCSALGLRPRLFLPQTMEDLLKNAQYQRGLLDVAVQLLKPGGTMVFSTCTISPLENENNVAYVLRRWKGVIELVKGEPCLGGAGIAGPVTAKEDIEGVGGLPGGWKERPGLTEEESGLVQRFDPGGELDTPGFFIAKFKKVSSGV